MRVRLTAAAIAIGAILALLAGALLSTSATAQTTESFAVVVSRIPLPVVVNGNATIQWTFDPGTNAVATDQSCSGYSPLGGTAILPAQVLSQRTSTASTFRLRIFNNLGQPVTTTITRPVWLNC